MTKDFMKRFTSPGLRDLVAGSGWVKLGLVVLIVAQTGWVKAQTSFSSPQVLTGDWGSVTNDNTGNVPDPGFSGIAGFLPFAPVWYQWTAPQSGEVELDTIGSVDDFLGQPLDTVLGVYTGNNVATLNQVAANDDLYPTAQLNNCGQNVYNTNLQVFATSSPYSYAPLDDFPYPPYLLEYYFYQPYGGPSGLRFNATAGTTYYFAVDTKSVTGSTVLNWAYHSSGVFRFATENVDETGLVNTDGTPMLLYLTSETESSRRFTGTVDAGQYDTTLHTYYDYDVPGVLVTVTRVAGSSGRVLVDYTTEDGNTNWVINGDNPAIANVTNIISYTNIFSGFTNIYDGMTNIYPGFTNIYGFTNITPQDYTPASGTLVFDDFEMSKSILIPIIDDYGIPRPNRDFEVVLSNPRLDPTEDSYDVSPPRVDNDFGQAAVRILDADIDPRGGSQFREVSTNGFDTNNNPIVVTNFVYSPIPTNAVFNFMKENFRVPRDVDSYWGATPVTVYVDRDGTNDGAASVNWSLNDFFVDKNGNVNWNNEFNLQPGSDYAVPNPPNSGGISGSDPDFNFSATGGTLTWAAGNFDPQPITFTVYNTGNPTFNKDIRLDIYGLNSKNHPVQVGMVNECTVTILFDDQNPPAGSVDELYNADYNTDLSLPVGDLPITSPADNPSPGTDGEVFSLALEPDNEALVAGDFSAYNGVGRNCLALLNTDGSLDTSFDPQGGVDPFNGFINSVALDSSNRPVIGGSFTSYNGTSSGNFARLTTNGLLDPTFSVGSGADGTVWAVAVQSDDKVLIGGDFTHINGVARSYIARLNSDGSLDTTFDPSTNPPDGPVYAIGLNPSSISTAQASVAGSTTPAENDYTFNVGANAGRLTGTFNMQGETNELQIYYAGNIIYDSGVVTNNGNFAMNVGPGAATSLLFVMNPGGVLSGTNWNYTATFTTTIGSSVYIGGDFMNVGGYGFSGIARLNSNGSLDPSFNPGLGADDDVYALGVLPDGSVLIGGAFTHVNGLSYNYLAKLDSNGAVDPTFMAGTGGADNNVYCILPQSDGTIYVGGQFTSFNGTHRLGFTRLYSDGTVDTTFMDTAYNQFAGLTRIRYDDTAGTVFSCGVQSDSNVVIGGSFDLVGGGQLDRNVRDNLDLQAGIAESFVDPNLWVEPKSRDGVRVRDNVARLIGGATPGPGNISLLPNGGSSYSATKSEQFLPVALVRSNGALGPLSANFSVQSGTAQNGLDYIYNAAAPYYGVSWEYVGPPDSRRHSDGLYGTNDFLEDIYGNYWWDWPETLLSAVTVSIIDDTANPGNLNANFQLSNPANADQFYLGGENIPLGGALGLSTAPLTIVDNNNQSGAFGFASSVFVATNASPVISVLRSNGIIGQVSMKYSTTNGTALAGTDYTALINQNLTFSPGVSSNGFKVSLINNSYIYTNTTEKYLSLGLSSLSPPVGYTASYGISNAVLRLINPNWQGYVTLGASNYSGTISSGSIAFTVKRITGSKGTVTVQYATTNGTAISGVDYIGATNTLLWNNGDVSSRTVSIPLIQTLAVGTTNKQFGVYLFNSTLNSSPTSLFYQMITNATLTISNDNSYGSLQFSVPVYTVDEDGGYATITVVRSGGAAGTDYVNYATSPGLNTTAGINYSNTCGVLTFAPGQLSSSFNVPIIDDGVQDAPPSSFYFDVSLSNSVNATLGTVSNAVVQIVDAESYNQPPGSPDVSFNSAGMNGDVLALALQTNGEIIAAGNFTDVGTVPEGYVARLNTDGTLDTGFLNGYSGANGPVQAVVSQTDDRVLIGGSFNFVDGVHRNYIARLMTDGSLDTSFNPGSGADSTVYAMAETFAVTGTNVLREIYVGGAFGSFNGVSSPSLVRLNNNGTVDPTFNVGLGANAPVLAIAAYPTNSIYAGMVLIGGSFTNFNGANVNYFARLNADGSLDPTFSANFGSGPSSAVNAIAIQDDGRILVGGGFTNFDGIGVNHIVRLNADGSVDTNFVANVGSAANGTVEGIAVQSDNRIVLVGEFTQANGLTRNRITRLLPTGAADPTINFGSGANGNVNAVVVQPADGMIVIGGGFTEYDGQPENYIARLYGGSMTGSGAFEFTAANYQVAENGVTAAITIQRTGGTSGTNADGTGSVFVNFATSDGTATNGINYGTVVTNIAFPAGEVLETVNVPVYNNFTITPNLTVNLTLSNPTPPAALGDQATAVLTILNVNSAISFASTYYSQAKNIPTGIATISLARQGSTLGTSTVDFYTTTNGTAVAGLDYYPTNAVVTFNPGDTVATAQVPIINNGIAEGNRIVDLSLTNATGSLLYAPTNAALTIIDTVTAPGQLSFATNSYVVNGSDPAAVLTVVRTNGSSGTVSMSYNTMDGTAQSNVNYQASSGTVTFGNGETAETITVPLLANSLVQGPVSFSVVLSNPTGGATLTAPTTSTVTILDNNFGVAFLNATNYVSETNSAAIVFVQRIGGTNGAFSVNYSTTNGTALAGVNYLTNSGSLNFASGEVLQSIDVSMLNHHDVTNLMFGMNLSGPTAGALLQVPSNAVVVVQAGYAGLSFTNSAVSVAKNGGPAILPVVCSNPNVEPVSVNYFTSDGTALAGQDYTAESGLLTFSNGITTNLIVVPIKNNTLVEGNRTFSVTLTNATAPGVLVSPYNQVVTIIDSNSGLSFSSPVYTVLKTGVSATITVLRTGNTNTVSSVNFATADGTGVAGTNYLANSGTLVFTNGVTSQTFPVTIIDSTTVQPDKTVLLQLSSPTNGILIPPSAATLTIHDTSGSLVVPDGSILVSGSTNGIIYPGNTVTLLFAFRASAGTNIANFSAILRATNGITSPSPIGTMNPGSLIVGGPPASQEFSFTASGAYTNSQQIAATFLLYNGGNSIGTAVFTYTLGTWQTTFYNTNAIIINDDTVASPYPSLINVSGVGGVLIKATTTLTNITHASPSDIDILLVAPSARDTLIMAHAGGQDALNNVTLTFDDAATNSLPPTAYPQTAITNGTYQPTGYLPVPNFP